MPDSPTLNGKGESSGKDVSTSEEESTGLLGSHQINNKKRKSDTMDASARKSKRRKLLSEEETMTVLSDMSSDERLVAIKDESKDDLSRGTVAITVVVGGIVGNLLTGAPAWVIGFASSLVSTLLFSWLMSHPKQKKVSEMIEKMDEKKKQALYNELIPALKALKMKEFYVNKEKVKEMLYPILQDFIENKMSAKWIIKN